jgi:predicted transcriptional regulator
VAHVLMAIKPRFAGLILSGEKAVEVRRGGTTIKPGDVLVLYSSSPDRTIRATCRVATVETRTVRGALSSMNGETGLTKDALRHYLNGAERVSLIRIESVARLSRPIPLTELRTNPRVLIPQSYRFLNDEEVRLLSPRLRP